MGNCGEHPRPSFGLPAELWRLDFSVARETSVFPGKKTTVLWLLRHPPSPLPKMSSDRKSVV